MFRLGLWTPLHFAILLKKEEAFTVLLNTSGINLDINGVDKLTPLHLAVKKNNLAMVKLLFEKRANFNIKNHLDFSPVDTAAHMDYLDIVTFLTESGANITKSALHDLVSSNQLEVVKYLIKKKKIDFNSRDSEGKTLLHWAAETGHVEMSDCLIDTGELDINGKESDGKTALHWASKNGYLAIVEKLLDKWMKINAQENLREIPLHLAAKNGHVAVVEKLWNKEKK